MRRPSSIATFVLLIAFVPALAQMRGGGRSSAGGHGGFAARGSFGGHMGGGHVFGGVPAGRGFSGSRFQSRGFSRSSSLRQPSSFGADRFRGDRFRHRRFRDFGFENCFGCRWGGWPWWYAGYYDPYWWWDSHSSYDEDRERELRIANEMNAQSLEQQQRMRESQDQDSYARADPPQSRQPEPGEVSTPPTVLVFRDQGRQDVQNYAIVGQTLWNFAPQRTQKIPLAELDLPATTKLNDERGVDFHIPSAAVGQ
jgi:hypothetical protein